MSKRAPPPEPSARANRSRQVAELLPDIGRAAFRRFGFVQSSIVSRWPEIVGVRLAGVSAPESIRFPPGKKQDGVLTLLVRGAHAPMMQHVAPEILERVNRFFGYPAVAKLVIRQGEVAAPAPRMAPPSFRAAPPTAEGGLSHLLGDSLKTVADPELKAVLEGLAGSIAAQTSVPVPVLGKIR